MFKSLKNKFTIIQVVTISIVLIVSFGVVFKFISDESTVGARHELDKIAAQMRDDRFNELVFTEQRRELYYIIVDDGRGQRILSNVNVDEEEIDEFLSEQSFEADEIVSIDDNYWIVRRVEGKFETSVIFLNITRQVNLVKSLRNALIAVGLFVLLIMTLISRYFASQAIKPIEKNYKKQEEFVSDAAHELRTPLTIINTNADVLLSDKQIKDSPNGKWLGYIKEEVKAMSDLTNELLQLSSNSEVSKQELDLSKIVANRILTFESIMFEKGITKSESIEQDIMVNGNEKQIVKLINILLDNAMKYSSDKHLEISLRRENRRVSLMVSNEVEGLTEDDIEHLFDRFYRKDKSRTTLDNKKSYGLGLSIAKMICEEHNAKIKASLADKKIEFVITI